ncbi:MAG: pitrilysin family protein [Candidatus Parcubacteria bacterium]|nr:pitrilysin family protein [Candidatus Parcubacteria bacterium]
MLNYEKKVLENGLRVIVAPMENTEATTLLALVKAGSRGETKKLNGISHFLEHLFFKGTKSRPKPGQVTKELNRVGAAYNAFTSKENTGFWVKSSAKDFDLGLDIVSDILLEPLFKKEEIEKERGVILQEISMYEDDPRRRVLDIMENVLYGDQPLGWDIAGTKETVKNIKRADVINYEEKNYLAGDTVVVAAGNIESKIVFKKIEKIFKRVRQGKNKTFSPARISGKFSKVKIIKKDSDQTHLAIAFNGYDMFDEKRHILNLLSVILGGNSSSRLYMEIREKLGLAYYVYGWGDQYTDTGYLGMGAGIPHQKMGLVIKKIISIIKEIKEKSVSQKDLNDAKSFIRGQMALRFETSDEIASYIAGQELFYKKILQPEEILKKIEKVNQSDILRIGREIFRPARANLAVIGQQEGDKKNEEQYKKILGKI